MRFVIRADAYAQSGAGHVMRSSVIAEELISRGFDVVFIGNTAEIPWLNKYVEKLGFREVLTSSDIFVSNPNSDVLILDSYSIPASDPKISPSKWFKIVTFVDDSTPQYTANLYIHAGLETTWSPAKNAVASEFLSGIDFIQIRESLRSLSANRNRARRAVPRILVIGGGSDPFGFVNGMYEVLSDLNVAFKATLITETDMTFRNDFRFSCVPFGIHVQDSLNEVDLVLTTAGTSSWEFIYLELNIGIACATLNQASNYQFQTVNKMSTGIGYRNPDGCWILDQEVISNLISDSGSKGSESLKVDGEGANRLFQALLKIARSSS